MFHSDLRVEAVTVRRWLGDSECFRTLAPMCPVVRLARLNCAAVLTLALLGGYNLEIYFKNLPADKFLLSVRP